jgi:hypothetical protein
MFAEHPVTGKPIRLMKNEVHLYKNRKTIAWLRDPPTSPIYSQPQKFNRWYTLVTEYTLAEEWRPVLGAYPSAIVITEPGNGAHHWLRTKAPKSREILFLSKAVMAAYGQENFNKEGFVNVVCLEELAPMFPHVLRSYVKGEPEALTALTVAALFRVQRAVGFGEEASTLAPFTEYLDKLKAHYQVAVGPIEEPEQLWLIQQYFEPEQAKRRREIQTCIEQNIKCAYIDKIVLLNEEDMTQKLPTSDKLVQQIVGHRLTYADVVLFIKEKVPENTLVVFANADIHLTDTWNDLWSVKMENVFLSLLRYDAQEDVSEEPKIFGPRPDSQDTWVVLSSSVKAREWNFDLINFQFGKSGCDNAINVEFLRKKFIVANPALTFQTVHHHTSQLRTYSASDIVDKPIFLYLEPTGLHDLAPATELKQFQKTWPNPSPFPRRVSAADPKHLDTFCAMASRDEKVTLEADADNVFMPQREEALYALDDTFVTPNGLAYGYDRIYLGKSQPMRDEWAKTNISHMTPCIGVESILAAPLADEDAQDMWRFTAAYLARIFRMRQEGYKGDMWLPRGVPRLHEFLQFFKWDQETMPVLPRDSDIVGYGKSVTLLTPRQEPSFQMYKEDVEALRNQLKSHSPEIQHPNRVTIFQDDVTLTAEDVASLENILENRGYEVNIVYPNRSSPSFVIQRLAGVGTCIATPGADMMLWMLPKAARVIDVMVETKIQPNGAHNAGAAQLEYWVTLLARAKGDQRSAMVVNRVMDTLAAIEAAKEKPKPHIATNKPKLVIPVGFKGLHAHNGDSFREMAAMWAERGWVDYEFSKETPYMWWGNIGETLLYDRATFDWLDETPVKYNLLLAGNPNANNVEKAKQWSFWPRHPKLVEARVKEGLPSWEERDKTMVFYGRVENKEQSKHRENTLHEACDEFDMPVGPDKPYKYKPKEYLNALATARYGLCLAGFGPKCNREIECMALGTVPVVAPDVDMDKYHNKPQEGVHYIRLKSFDPAEAKEQVAAITQEKWQIMSKLAHDWWRQNGSAEGLFAITKELTG